MTKTESRKEATPLTGELRVIISGGGTGGHIFPAISIANEVRRRYPDSKILFVGAEKRMEMERVPRAGYEITGLPVMGFDRKRLWRNFKVVFKLLGSMGKAKKIIRDFKPDIAVGVGGYASGPTLKAAQKAGVPTLLQEQNSYAGVTNKMLAKKAKVICVAYDGMERFFPAETIVKTGNPIRSSILECDKTQSEAKEVLGFSAEKPLLLVVGGSLGSLTINNAVKAALDAFEEAGISVLWQTGKFYAEECADAAKGRKGITATPFIDDMAVAYRAADLVVSRAGASTISELQLLGKPSILVPSPNVAEDHQTKNAMALVNQQAAEMIPDAEAVEKLKVKVTELITNSKRLEEMGINILKMALPRSAERIVDKLEAVIKGEL